MSRFQEISNARKGGNIDEAWKLADTWLEEVKLEGSDEETLWAKRAMSWVLYDMLKRATENDSIDDALKILEQVKALAMPDGETMFFEKITWAAVSLVAKVNKLSSSQSNLGEKNTQRVYGIFSSLKELPLSKPSQEASVLIANLHRGLKNHIGYLELIDWFGIENLRFEDHQPYVMDNGKKIMSLAEQVYGNYSRLLASGEEMDEIDGFVMPKGTRVHDEDKISKTIEILTKVLQKHPDLKFTRYFLYSLYNAIEQPDEAKKVIIPFVKKQSGEFWVWDKLGDAESDRTKKIACYCRALQAKAPDEFLVKIRRKLAKLLVEEKLYDEAKTELHKHIAVMEQNGWGLSKMVLEMKETSWYTTANVLSHNNNLYAVYRKHTDELLHADLPEKLIVVSYVNKAKGVLNFYASRKEEGFFKYTGLVKDPAIGDILKVRMKAVDESGFHKVFKAEKSNQLPPNDIVLDFEGTYKKPENMPVGFVDYGQKSGILVEPKFIQNINLTNGSKVKGRAIISFNSKRNEWGYKAIHLKIV